MNHTPILVDEILNHMKEIAGGVNLYLDGTFGRGGHLREVLTAFPDCRAFVLDKDLDAIAYAKVHFKNEIESERVNVIHADYTQIKEIESLTKKSFDAILLDLGVSSPQLDNAARGFSFLNEGPLDMRMNQKQAITARDLVNEWSEDDLKNLFRNYGEVDSPSRVVRAIVHDRREKSFETTIELASLIERVEGWKKKGIHPATKYFMALRIQVNNELEHLEAALTDILGLLREGGRLFVITFHSLEDRIVKQVFQSSSHLGFSVNRRVIVPGDEEQKRNPRSRSAKLRIFERSPHGEIHRRKKDKYADRKGH